MHKIHGKYGAIIETIIIIGLLLGSLLVALRFLGTKGIEPGFQFYFEPAVMMTCGHGFVSSRGHAGKALQKFLNVDQKTFSCDQLPAHFTTTNKLRLWGWYYQVLALSLTWKIFGINWLNVNYLVALLFALSILAAYASYRTIMWREVALIGAIIFMLSSIHHEVLISLRDYSRAPFILFAVFIMILTCVKPLKNWQLYLTYSLLGAILAIGYGFRSDVLIVVPAIFISTLFFLTPTDKLPQLRKIICLILFCVVFIIVALPMLLSPKTPEMGSCFWHIPTLGFNNNFTIGLGLKPALYSLFYEFGDEASYSLVAAHAHYFHQITQTPLPCSPIFDKINSHVFWQIVTTFPADIIIRALSSLKIVLTSKGIVIASFFILLLIACKRYRYGLFATLGILYFFSYPALFFQSRHYFYQHAFIWLFLGFIISRLLFYAFSKEGKTQLSSFKKEISIINVFWAIIRVIVYVLCLLGIIFGLLYSARIYQDKKVTKIINQYLSANISPINTVIHHDNKQHKTVFQFNWPRSLVEKHVDPAKISAKMLRVIVSAKNCNVKLVKLFFVYDTSDQRANFNVYMQTVLQQKTDETNLFLPIYFKSGDISPMTYEAPLSHMKGNFALSHLYIPENTNSQCIQSINEVNLKDLPPIWLTLNLPSHWRNLKKYQTMFYGEHNNE